MKFLHISDLHLGKRIHEFSLMEEQAYILNQIISIAESERPDAVLIAGDIYDKSVPSAEAVNLFDGFLEKLSKRQIKTFIISGNHDSPERIAFGNKIMAFGGIYLSPVYNGVVESIKMQDEFGSINVFMLPFVKPSHVKRFFEDEEINSYTDAINVAVSHMNIDKTARNILITHQFVTGGVRSESEESIGGTDNVDAEVFKMFDYVALGHLHRAQNCGSNKIRYSGTPLKYSFSEKNDNKSITIVQINEKNSKIIVNEIPLIPLHDMGEIRGKFEVLISKEFYDNCKNKNDFLRIILTDEEDVLDAMSRLRVIYKNALTLAYDNARTKRDQSIIIDDENNKKSAMQLFSEFFEMQNNQKMSKEQEDTIKKLIEKVEEDMI